MVNAKSDKWWGEHSLQVMDPHICSDQPNTSDYEILGSELPLVEIVVETDTQDRNYILHIYIFNAHFVKDTELIDKVVIHLERPGL